MDRRSVQRAAPATQGGDGPAFGVAEDGLPERLEGGTTMAEHDPKTQVREIPGPTEPERVEVSG